MSATAFLRQRRAVAAQLVRTALAGKSSAKVAEVLEARDLDPNDLQNLDSNNDVLSIADAVAAVVLDEPELDTLEELNTMEGGPRADVHSRDVRVDQVEKRLQHPAQETVGVGNMHDGPQAGEALANVGSPEIEAAIAEKGMSAEDRMTFEFTSREAFEAGLEQKVARMEEAQAPTAGVDPSPLSAHGALPEPNAGPVDLGAQAPAGNADGSTETPLDAEHLAESAAAGLEGKPSDPDGEMAGVAATPVDVAAAGAAALKEDKANDKLDGLTEAAFEAADRDELIAMAGRLDLDLGAYTARTSAGTIRTRALEAAKAKGLING